MSVDLIRVTPVRAHRKAFAAWAIAQSPQVRTVSHEAFVVPATLYADVPEELLTGALIDGHRYVSPQPAMTVLELEEAAPGEPLPPLPESAYPPGAVPLDVTPVQAPEPAAVPEPATEPAPEPEPAPAAAEDETGSDSSDQPGDTEGHVCAGCERPFKSKSGLATHRRTAHPEES